MIDKQDHSLSHNVQQLHGGGALVLSELIKCAILEIVTGKRIPELFQSIIADSGGAIIALCLYKMPAIDILDMFMEGIPEALPSASFFIAQPLPRTPNRFDNKKLESILESILGTATLSDITGNIFIRTHSIEDRAQRIAKITRENSPPEYKNAGPTTRLLDIAMAASAIPGVMPEHEDAKMDPIADQNPTAILYRLKTTFPDKDIRYVQMGNIYSTEIVKTLRSISFLRSIVTGIFQNYVSYHNHSAHIEDVRDILPNNKIMSLLTFAPGRYSSTNNSAHQRTRVAVATLNDIEKRADDYTSLAQTLSGTPSCAQSVQSALSLIKAKLDPYMVKEKIVTDDPYNFPAQFPTPEIVYLHDTPAYKTGYFLGQLSAHYAPAIAKQLVKHDFNLRAAFESVGRKLLPLSKLPANDEGGRNPLPPETRSIER